MAATRAALRTSTKLLASDMTPLVSAPAVVPYSPDFCATCRRYVYLLGFGRLTRRAPFPFPFCNEEASFAPKLSLPP